MVLDIEFIPRIINSMIVFLKPIVPSSIFQQYSSILELDPMEQKCAIQREIKPYEFCLEDFIEEMITKHGLKVEDFRREDILKFKRYLSALCDAV